MKPSSLLPLAAVSSLAHSYGQHESEVGICDSGAGFSSLLANIVPVCRPDARAQGRLTPAERGDTSRQGTGTASSCHANGTACAHNHHQQRHHWTSSTPCFMNAERDQKYCVFTDGNFAEKRGMSIVTTPERAAYIAQRGAFRNPNVTRGTNQDIFRTIPAKYKVVTMPGKGKGVVATDYIMRGDLIMANTASYMFDYGLYADLTYKEYRELQAQAIDALPEAHRERILDLSTHDPEVKLSREELVSKLTGTNAFDIYPDEEDPEQEMSFLTVFPEIARMNHDCRPNADYLWDHDSMTQRVHAIRHILPGEEITVSYIDPMMLHAARIKRLKVWGFSCGCAACTATTAAVKASDDRLQQIGELEAELRSYKRSSRATPQMAELVISLFEQERMWSRLSDAYTWAALEWNGIGEPWTATRYARLAIEYGIYSVGEKSNDVAEMTKLANDPWSHKSWMLRQKTRMGWSKDLFADDGEEEEDSE